MLGHFLSRSGQRTRGERGATAVEYGLLLTGIAALLALVVYAFGDNVTDLFTDTCETISDARATGDCE
jgi:pilus assembly protein Flp/PilA